MARERRVGTSPACAPEGSIKAQIASALRNVDAFYVTSLDRIRLRRIALVRDTFKYQVDIVLPRSGENHHAMRARRFAEHVADPALLDRVGLNPLKVVSRDQMDRAPAQPAGTAAALRHN